MIAQAVLATALTLSPIVFKEYIADEKAVVRPMQKSLIGFTSKQLNEFRQARNIALYSGDICFVEAMRRDGLALTDRQSQASMESSYATTGGTFDLVAKGDIRLTVGIYEKCKKENEDDKLWGSILIATQNGKLMWAEEYPGVTPLFLFPSRGTHLAVLSSCMECGDVTELYYDPANRKFHTQYVGD